MLVFTIRYRLSLNKAKMQKKNIFTLLFLFITVLAYGRLMPPGQDTEVYRTVERMPSFPAQYGTPNEFLASRVIYPANAIQNNIEGKVILQFVVDRDGSIIQPEVLKGLGYGCDEAALGALMEMPKWKPGRQNGKRVKVYYMLPLIFKLQPIPDSHLEFAGAFDSTYRAVEKMPEFPGGERALMHYLNRNMNYPKSARRQHIEGIVYIQFTVTEKGKVANVKLIKGIDLDCDEEALRVVRNMPDWAPGMQNGKEVNVFYTLPITFKLKPERKPFTENP